MPGRVVESLGKSLVVLPSNKARTHRGFLRPYTITDKTGPVNYRVQLIDGSQTVVVHQSHLKMCYSPPQLSKAVPSSASEQHSPTSPTKPSEGVSETDSPQTSAPLFGDVVKEELQWAVIRAQAACENKTQFIHNIIDT